MNTITLGQLEIKREQPEIMLPELRENAGADSPCWKVLQRYSWAGGIAIESHGVRLGIRVTDAALLDQISQSLPPGWLPSPSQAVDSLFSLIRTESRSRSRPEPHFFLHRDSCRIAHARDAEEALAALESGLHTQVAESARGSLFVHAGVAAWQGKAIVVPGRSFSGKTSLVAALVRAGADYCSDEYAVLDEDGLVHPYPKLLSLRDSAGQPVAKRSIESLGGRAAALPLPIGLILDTHYVQGARWRPRPVSPGAALFTLLDNTVQVRSQPGLALRILQKAVSSAAAVKSRRGEADAVASWALAYLCDQA